MVEKQFDHAVLVLQHRARLEPSATGSLVYLDARPTVNATLERVKRAGGKVEEPAVQLPNDIGWIGFFTDTEGNRIGLHSKTNG
jgi:hypothetical protein